MRVICEGLGCRLCEYGGGSMIPISMLVAYVHEQHVRYL